MFLAEADWLTGSCVEDMTKNDNTIQMFISVDIDNNHDKCHIINSVQFKD